MDASGRIDGFNLHALRRHGQCPRAWYPAPRRQPPLARPTPPRGRADWRCLAGDGIPVPARQHRSRSVGRSIRGTELVSTARMPGRARSSPGAGPYKTDIAPTARGGPSQHGAFVNGPGRRGASSRRAPRPSGQGRDRQLTGSACPRPGRRRQASCRRSPTEARMCRRRCCLWIEACEHGLQRARAGILVGRPWAQDQPSLDGRTSNRGARP